MKRPQCGLCQRTGDACDFPTTRKAPIKRKMTSQKAKGRQPAKPKTSRNLDRIVGLLAKMFQLNEGGLSTEAQEVSLAPLTSDTSPSAHISPSQPGTAAASESQAADIMVPDCSPELDAVGIRHQSPPAHPVGLGAVGELEEPDPDGMPSPGFQTKYAVDLPHDVVLDLIDIFFTKVQVWLPIFHRPRFYQRYMVQSGDSIQPIINLSIEEALILHCMFALSARFSRHSYFRDMSMEDRNRHFGERSEALYHKARAIEIPNLPYLQGCILYSFYYYTNVPNSRGWLLAGVVLRLAFDLELNRIDEDGGQGLSGDWVYREERRRAWWLVWEIDAFGSTLFSRPYGIDMREVTVLLPVSDEAWFADTPVASTLLDSRATAAWKALQGCENQDERAWFLVATYLMTLAHRIPRRTGGFLSDEVQELGAVLTCFRLSLPQRFHMETGFFFDSKTFSRCNWIIATHLITLGPRALNGNLVAPRDMDTLIHAQPALTSLQARIFAQELCQIASRWPVEFIPFCHPFIAGTLTGPAHLHSCIHGDDWIDPLVDMGHAVSKLVLGHFAQYWIVGKVFLQVMEIIRQRRAVTLNEQRLAKRYQVLIPPKISSRTAESDTMNGLVSPATSLAQGSPREPQDETNSPLGMQHPKHPAGAASAAHHIHSHGSGAIVGEHARCPETPRTPSAAAPAPPALPCPDAGDFRLHQTGDDSLWDNMDFLDEFLAAHNSLGPDEMYRMEAQKPAVGSAGNHEGGSVTPLRTLNRT